MAKAPRGTRHLTWANRPSGNYRPRPPWRRRQRSIKAFVLWRLQQYLQGFGLFVVIFAAVWLYSVWTGDSPSRPAFLQSASGKDIVGRASVIDGDTFEIHGQRIRVWGVDAPESAQLCHIAGKPWRCGQQAALAVSDHIGLQTVACLERDRDRYGRIVAKCSVASQDIGVWLVSNGWALDYAQYSGGGYSSHQTSAASAKLGIWKGEFDKPWEWRRTKQ